jgi:hypothetical protein
MHPASGRCPGSSGKWSRSQRRRTSRRTGPWDLWPLDARRYQRPTQSSLVCQPPLMCTLHYSWRSMRNGRAAAGLSGLSGCFSSTPFEHTNVVRTEHDESQFPAFSDSADISRP